MGTPSNDVLTGFSGQVLGFSGNDILSTPTFAGAVTYGQGTFLLGGSGEDIYNIHQGNVAMIYDTSGYDTVNIDINPFAVDSIAAVIDGQHLAIENTSSGTDVIILNAVNEGKIENINANGVPLSVDALLTPVLPLREYASQMLTIKEGDCISEEDEYQYYCKHVIAYEIKDSVMYCHLEGVH